MIPTRAILAASLLLASAPLATAQQMGAGQGRGMMSPGLMLPMMDPAEGKRLFVEKGCVTCHSINGVGGKDAPALDASTMDMPMSPFEFFAKMWRGAPAMIEAQEDELGSQIEFTGEELGNIVAFVHDAAMQKTFSEGDIPHDMLEMMEHMEEHEDGDAEAGEAHN